MINASLLVRSPFRWNHYRSTFCLSQLRPLVSSLHQAAVGFIRVSICECTQPMRDDVTLQCCISLYLSTVMKNVILTKFLQLAAPEVFKMTTLLLHCYIMSRLRASIFFIIKRWGCQFGLLLNIWINNENKQRVLMHRHQGLNVRHGLCHIYMRYLYIYELFIAFVCFVVCSLL